MHLVHLVASHHGLLEHGSPKEPQTLEALVVHALDELDSRIAAFGAIFERDATPGSFTSYQRLYDRHLFKLPSWNGEPPSPDPRRFGGPGLYEESG
jgi:3'-5' exoribonuclease